MPVQGIVRRRKHQFTRQSAFGTVEAATRAYPFKGVPEVDLSWTDPEIDEGSLDPVAAPHRDAPKLTAPLTDPQLGYNTIPLLMSGFFGGRVEPTGSGTAKTWLHHPESATVDPIDPFCYEFGDDVLTDWYQFGDGILETLEVTIPSGLGPVTTSMGWHFGSVASTGSTDSPVTGSVPTPGLDVDTNPALVYGKDLSIFIASDPDYLDTSQIMDALHSGVIRFGGDIDEKRWANGTQKFDVDAYARATRSIEYEFTFSKTADTVGLGSESDAWMSDQSVDRYVRLQFLSTVLAQAPSTFYEWTLEGPSRYYTRSEGEEGGNTVIVLTGHAFYDPTDFEGVFESTAVTTLASEDLGAAY